MNGRRGALTPGDLVKPSWRLDMSIVTPAADTATPGEKRFDAIIGNDDLSPTWLKGDRVEFRVLPTGEAFVVGQDYFVRTFNGEFWRRCTSVDGDSITFAKPDGIDPTDVARDSIEFAAVAVWVYMNRSEAVSR
jgi:hypothetical protein